MHGVEEFFAGVYAQLGYPQIVLMMALESSLFPVPSEVVMIPAGYRAASGELDPVLCVLAGTLGSMLGASANYLLGRFVGRAFLLRWGRWLLIDSRRYHEAEAMFLGNAALATFVGRLLPVVRHLISLPAGVFGMRVPVFLAATAAGAALWCSVLVAFGYYLGEPALALVRGYTHELALAVLAGLVALGAWFLLRARRRGAR